MSEFIIQLLLMGLIISMVLAIIGSLIALTIIIFKLIKEF